MQKKSAEKYTLMAFNCCWEAIEENEFEGENWSLRGNLWLLERENEKWREKVEGFFVVK